MGYQAYRRRGRRSTGTRSGKRRLLRTLGGLLVAALVAGVAVEWATWPDVARLATERPDTTAFMYRYLERRAADPELPALRWRWTPLAGISPHVQRAVVSGEDMEFFQHGGFSSAEIRAALEDALRGGRVRGASTITQQLAKNLWLTPSRNPLRKIREALLTRALEKHLTKSRILEVYLNVVELGPGIYGVGAASSHYFGTGPAGLTERQAAMLAASLPRPSSWHPGVESSAYAGYVRDILGRMERAQFLWGFVQGEAPTRPAAEPIPEPTRVHLTEPALAGGSVGVDSLAPDSAMGGVPAADSLAADSLIGDSLAADSLVGDSTSARPVSAPDSSATRDSVYRNDPTRSIAVISFGRSRPAGP